MHAICVWTAVKHALRCVCAGEAADRLAAAGDRRRNAALSDAERRKPHATATAATAAHGRSRSRDGNGIIADKRTPDGELRRAIAPRLTSDTLTSGFSRMPTPHGFVEKLAELSRSGAPFVSVTMVEAVGSTPQDAGTKMLVDAAGLVFGTVGGGKVENKAIEHRTGDAAPSATAPTGRLVEWNLQRDVGMTCGGVVKLFFEAYNHRDWRIVVFGAGHVAQALVRCLLELECQRGLHRSAGRMARPSCRSRASCRRSASNNMPEYVEPTCGRRVRRLHDDGARDRSADSAGNLSPGPPPRLPGRHRQPGQAQGDAPRTRRGRHRRTSLAEQFRCPIGLPLGTNQPGEIAISVAAELIQVRDATAARCDWRRWTVNSCHSARRRPAFPIASHTLGSMSLLITCTEPSQNISALPAGARCSNLRRDPDDYWARGLPPRCPYW